VIGEEVMQLTKIGAGVGLGMAAVGFIGTYIAKGNSRTGHALDADESGGSLIVLGATLVFISKVLSRWEKP
jgi:hypothetical protein